MIADAVALVLVLVVLLGAAVLGVMVIGLEAELAQAERRFARLRAFRAEALRLAEARGRLRRSQKRFERFVDAGATSVETAHRTVAGPNYRGAPFYDGLRRINQYVGRGVSSWLTSSAPSPRWGALSEWRSRRHRREK
ncbi:hypothetical protein V5738_16215 [Salinisphaera sp. SPP-AMP-43]|uniref:hypothetical protein n=1 Tax=Salinisphaera sp. SPP-AMP-43 TaxID=3121288 RepID=UPI003C6E05FC